MANWWVNHKQTYRQEVEGGYIWSPKTRKDGGRNHFYDNLQRVQAGDLVFSFANAQIHDVGVATSTAKTMPKPTDFGKAGDEWSATGWLVPVEFHRTKKPLRPKAHMQAIGPLLPERYSPIRESGDGNQVAYLAEISDELSALLLRLINDPSLQPRLEGSMPNAESDDALEQEVWERPDIPETTKRQLVLSRRGQGVFRRRVEGIEPSCRVTGLSEPQHLRASHVKPWRTSSDEERLDGSNGLLLAVHIDHLFDSGYISFAASGELLISPRLSKNAHRAFNLSPSLSSKPLTPDQERYMAYHRKQIFHSTS